MSILIDSTGQSPYKRSFSFCNYVIISCFLLFGFVLTSCDQETYNAKSIMKKHVGDDGHKWYSYEFENKLGICDEEGNVKVLPKYDSIKYVSDGKFYELKEVVEKGDTAIVILTQNYKPLLGKSLKIKSYEKREWKDIDNRYYYEVSSETGCGAFDKNWQPIFYPYLADKTTVTYQHESDYFKFKGRGVERFLLYISYNKNRILLPLTFKMDDKSSVVQEDDPLIVNYVYLYASQIYRAFSFYKNYIINFENHTKYTFQYSEDGLKIFTNIDHRENGEILKSSLTVDNYFNIKGYRQWRNSKEITDDRIFEDYSYTKAYDSEGVNLMPSIMKEIYSKGNVYNQHLLSLKQDSAEIIENNLLWIKMNKSVRQGFKDKINKILKKDDTESLTWNTVGIKYSQDYFCQHFFNPWDNFRDEESIEVGDNFSSDYNYRGIYYVHYTTGTDTQEFTFYDDYIEIRNDADKRKGTSTKVSKIGYDNGWTVYYENIGGFSFKYLVNSNYDIQYYNGNDVVSVTKASQQVANSGRNSLSNTTGEYSNYNSSKLSVGNPQKHTQTVNRIPCKNCVNGRMVVERSISVTKFGLEHHMNKCTECGKSYDASEYSHIHQNCTYCKGKGYIE